MIKRNFFIGLFGLTSILVGICVSSFRPVVSLIQRISGVTLDVRGEQVVRDTLSFFYSRGATISDVMHKVYAEEELNHLYDVRKALFGVYIVLLLCAVVLGLWYCFRKHDFIQTFQVSQRKLRAVALYLVAAGIASIFFFDPLFEFGHTLLFPAGTWQFPADYMLIQLFPYQFWVTWVSVVWFTSVAVLFFTSSIKATVKKR